MNAPRRNVTNRNLERGRLSQDASSRRALRDQYIESLLARQTRSTGRPTATPSDPEQGYVYIPIFLAPLLLPGFQLFQSEPPRTPTPGEANVEEINSGRRQRTPDTDVNSVEIGIAQRNLRRRLNHPQPPSVLHVAPPSSPPPQQLGPTYTCSVCLEPMIEEAMSTKCGHLFCEGCIRIAISSQAKCPLCRCRITKKELLRVFFPGPI